MKEGFHSVKGIDELRLVDVAKIDSSPWEIRKEKSKPLFDENIRHYGIQQPIKVRPVGDRLQVIYGDRRLETAKELGLKQIFVFIHPCSDDEALELHGAENLCRNDWLPIEEGQFFTMLRKHGHSVPKMSQTYNQSIGQISERIALFEAWNNKFSPEAKKAVVRGDVSVSAIEYVLDNLPEQKAIEVIEYAAKNHMNLEDTMAHVQTILPAVEVEKKARTLGESTSYSKPTPPSVPEYTRVHEYPIVEGEIKSISKTEREIMVKTKNNGTVNLIAELLLDMKQKAKLGDWLKITVRIETPYKPPSKKEVQTQKALVEDFQMKMKGPRA